jgi:cellulose synthase/poly-beta-1,6-N-acetylglucosamine synthase-like glycosyltransferase
LLVVLHTVVALWLSLYGFQALALTILYFRHRRASLPAAQPAEGNWPSVAVQLPVYNERYVVERLIDAAAALNYPRGRLTIQVLDDSTDDTTSIAEARARLHRAAGIDVCVMHRTDRAGFKAGALSWGLAQTAAEFVAVFDADFRPKPDFLRKTVSAMVEDPRAGMVQTRWSHLNDEYSYLTHAQSLALDGHFVVEQTARNRSGLLINFNGSGGVWRRACIEDAGGWQADTMTEDMDLSYRAQLAGWGTLYLPDVDAPAELPAQMEAFKRQQARWAQGSVQCLRKLTPRILRSDLRWYQKLMALVHVSGYLSQPLIVLLLLTMLPLLWTGQAAPGFLIALVFASVGPPLLYAVAQAALYRDWKRRFLYLPALLAVGAGMTWSTTKAVWQGLTTWGGVFKRTPKFRIEGKSGRWNANPYRLRSDWTVLGEITLFMYAILTVSVAILRGQYAVLPFLMLYVIGYGVVATSSLWQGHGARSGG